jgi:hypothetical protein
MDRVEEIEAAIENLAPDEFRRIAQWLRDRDQLLWDQHLDSDSAAGKLDFLFEEAEHEGSAALVREWPPTR